MTSLTEHQQRQKDADEGTADESYPSSPNQRGNEDFTKMVHPSFLYRNFLHTDAKFMKLVTYHDTFHVHKIFGILSVLSFIYRYAYVYPMSGSLGFGDLPEGVSADLAHPSNSFNWVTMIVHTLLAFSSIIFYVPRKRLNDKPMIIYEEYRQHAMVFCSRCFLVFACAKLFPGISFPPVVAVLLCHLMVDRITSIWGDEGNTAVRATAARAKIERDAKQTKKDKKNALAGWAYKHLTKFYSIYQFMALASHILPNDHLADLGFNALIAIQSSAFFMTLYRKRIIRAKAHMLIYSACLVLSMFHIFRLLTWTHSSLIFVAFFIRINLPRFLGNKYLVWSCYLIACHWATFNAYVLQPFIDDVILSSKSKLLGDPADTLINGPPVVQGISAAALCFLLSYVDAGVRAALSGKSGASSSSSSSSSSVASESKKSE